MTVSGTVRSGGDPAAAVEGAVVRATNLDTGQVDGEATTDSGGAYRIEGLRGDRYAIEVTPPSGYLSVAPEIVSRSGSGELQVSVDFSLIPHRQQAPAVTTLPAGELISLSANHFDLEGKALTFIPNGAGRYSVAIDDVDWRDPPAGALVRHGLDENDHVTVDLPFPFPFAGRTWTSVHANANGNISFRRFEREHWPHRNGWADGTMRLMGAAIDSRSAAGLEAMIAALWARYDHPTISVDSTPSRVVVTWRAVRDPAYAPLGENLFQARLYPSGMVQLAYRSVAERDGIVGLLHGGNTRGRTLDSVEDPASDVARGFLDILRVEWADNGSTILARITLAGPVPTEIADGEITYGLFLRFGNNEFGLGIEVTEAGRSPWTSEGGDTAIGHTVQGATIELFFSKTLLGDANQFSWDADAVWWGRGEYDHLDYAGSVEVGESDRDLSAGAGAVAGNLFEVFHYPVMTQGIRPAISSIYERVPANDELVVVFTDFRFDRLYSSGSGSGPVNIPVEGVGTSAHPGSGEDYGSDRLLVTMAPVFVGGPHFAFGRVEWGYEQRNFPHATGWIAHELVHRWASHLRFRNPRSGRIEDLFDEWCECHWSRYLHQPVVHPVWPGWSAAPYPEVSVMGASVWEDNADGTFTRSGGVWPSGLSALDLYVMGMIPAEEVPDTFLLTDVQETSESETVRATKVPVRIEDIVAVMGPRVPAADAAQKEFTLAIYLLHEDGRPPRPELLDRAQSISAAVSEYFRRATGGRMRVVPSNGPGE